MGNWIMVCGALEKLSWGLRLALTLVYHSRERVAVCWLSEASTRYWRRSPGRCTGSEKARLSGSLSSRKTWTYQWIALSKGAEWRKGRFPPLTRRTRDHRRHQPPGPYFHSYLSLPLPLLLRLSFNTLRIFKNFLFLQFFPLFFLLFYFSFLPFLCLSFFLFLFCLSLLLFIFLSFLFPFILIVFIVPFMFLLFFFAFFFLFSFF